jgi:hypothetical protein
MEGSRMSAFQGMSADKIAAEQALLRDADPTPDQMEGEYTPRRFIVVGAPGESVFIEQAAIDVSVNALDHRDADTPIVSWEVANSIASLLYPKVVDKNGRITAAEWTSDDEISIVTIDPDSAPTWGLWRKPDSDPARFFGESVILVGLEVKYI